MNTQFGILFSVEVLHDYYADGRCPDLVFIPTASTLESLRGAGIVVKPAGNQLLAGAPVDAIAGNLRVPLPANIIYSFYLVVQNPHFYQFTNLTPEKDKIHYLSNLSGHAANSQSFLHTALPTYNNATAYATGNLVLQGNEVFEAIRSGTNHPTSDAGFWIKKTGKAYLNPTGQLIKAGDFADFPVAVPAASVTANVYAYNAASGVFDHLLHTQIIKSDSPQSIVTVDLRRIPIGKYRIEIAGTDTFVYKNATLPYGTLGVVEISNSLAPGASMAILDNLGKPQAKKYLIQLPGRSVIWKYRNRKNVLQTVSEKDGPSQFTKSAGTDYDDFISTKPIPFSQTPNAKMSALTQIGNITYTPLKNAAYHRLAKQVVNGETYLCAEIYLNF